MPEPNIVPVTITGTHHSSFAIKGPTPYTMLYICVGEVKAELVIRDNEWRRGNVHFEIPDLHFDAAAMVSESAQDQKLNHGIAFALTNLTWAAGQAIAASGSGALAEATSDAVPYLLLGAACLATLSRMLRIRPSEPPDLSPEAD